MISGTSESIMLYLTSRLALSLDSLVKSSLASCNSSYHFPFISHDMVVLAFWQNESRCERKDRGLKVFGSGFATLGRGAAASSRRKEEVAGVVLWAEFSLNEQSCLLSPCSFPCRPRWGPGTIASWAAVEHDSNRSASEGEGKRQRRVVMGTKSVMETCKSMEL